MLLSPDKSSPINGLVERAVQEVEGMNRSLCIALGTRMGLCFDTRERIVAFMTEYAACLLNRLHIGEDSRVPYEMIKGKSPTILEMELGERLLYRLRSKDNGKLKK